MESSKLLKNYCDYEYINQLDEYSRNACLEDRIHQKYNGLPLNPS
jgi:hypothetical protein